jgi:hypothetical protein
VIKFTLHVFFFWGGSTCTQRIGTRWGPQPCLDLLELKNNFFMPRRKLRFLDYLIEFFLPNTKNQHTYTLFYCKKLRESDKLDDQGVDEKIVLVWILRNSNGRTWSSGFMWIFALLGCYVALIGSYLSTFQNKLSVPPSRIKQSCSLLCANGVVKLGASVNVLEMLRRWSYTFRTDVQVIIRHGKHVALPLRKTIVWSRLWKYFFTMRMMCYTFYKLHCVGKIDTWYL